MSTNEEKLKRLMAASDSLSTEMNPAKRARLRARIDSLSQYTPEPSRERDSKRKKGLLSRIFGSRRSEDPIESVNRSVGEKMRGSIRDSAGRQSDSLRITQEELQSRINSEKDTRTRNRLIREEHRISEQRRTGGGR